jgi:hypothetical protein
MQIYVFQWLPSSPTSDIDDYFKLFYLGLLAMFLQWLLNYFI